MVVVVAVVVVIVAVYFILSRLLYLAFSTSLGLLCIPWCFAGRTVPSNNLLTLYFEMH